MADNGRQLPSSKSHEGGWGYMIVASVFLMRFLVTGFYQTQSFVLVEWQREFSTSSAEASVMVSMGLIVIGVASPIGGTLATIFGTRAAVMTGGLLAGLGMIGTMLMESVLGIILTWGVMIGLGFALVFAPAIVKISQYFDEHFTVANGVAYAGGAVGQICYPLLTSVLIGNYGWRGAILILSAITFHLVISGAVLRPKRAETFLSKSGVLTDVVAHENSAFDRIEAEHESSTMPSSKIASSECRIKLTSDTRHIVSKQQYADVVSEADVNGIKLVSKTDTPVHADRYVKTICRHWETVPIVLKSIFKNISFDIMLVVFFINGFIFFAPVSHAIPQALEAGISESKAAILPTVFGIGNLIGQVGPTFIADFLHIPRGVIGACAFATCSVLNLLNPFFNSYWHHTVFHVVYGTAAGTQQVFIYTIVQVILRPKHRVMAVGFATFIDSLGYAAGALCAGWLVDATGAYNASSFLCSGLAAIGGILMIYVTFMSRIKVNKLTVRAKTWIINRLYYLYGVCYILH
ncbi:monocarboxylate transporter 13-like [Amphiura filiformis]|uniref:monocarboxylate transporter 13-like n=1 Tax=Amphiura filiformis TaxID=82378 RepID=UPI003B220F02